MIRNENLTDSGLAMVPYMWVKFVVGSGLPPRVSLQVLQISSLHKFKSQHSKFKFKQGPPVSRKPWELSGPMHKAIYQGDLYLKKVYMYIPETSCMKELCGQIKDMTVKQLCNHEV